MSELVTKSVGEEQQERKIETRTTVERIAGFAIVATVVAARTSAPSSMPLRI